LARTHNRCFQQIAENKEIAYTKHKAAMDDVPLLRIVPLTLMLLFLSGCKLAVILVEGGKVQSTLSGTCQITPTSPPTGTVCIHKVTDTTYADSFTAVPDSGWEFVNWNSGNGFFCADSTNAECAVSNVLLAGNSFAETIVASDQMFYLMPVFARSTSDLAYVSRNFISGNYVVDLDSDGDLDVVNPAGGVSWHENQAGVFIPHALPFSARMVLADDMDNDGDIDLVTASGSVITLYKNDGSEGFSVHQEIERVYTQFYDSHGIYLADMDSDGNMDVIAAWLSQDWYRNDGDGNLATQQLVTRGGGKDIIAIDLDRDGDMDFIESDNDIIWHVNNGSEEFSKVVLLHDGGAASFPIDIDKDNDVDVISVARHHDEIYLFVNNGSNTFSTQTVALEKNSPHIFASDIDNDGYIDILNGNVWYKNNGSQSFTNQGNITLDNATLIGLAE
jgi:FG-GAP-like repeat